MITTVMVTVATLIVLGHVMFNFQEGLDWELLIVYFLLAIAYVGSGIKSQKKGISHLADEYIELLYRKDRELGDTEREHSD